MKPSQRKITIQKIYQPNDQTLTGKLYSVLIISTKIGPSKLVEEIINVKLYFLNNLSLIHLLERLYFNILTKTKRVKEESRFQ